MSQTDLSEEVEIIEIDVQFRPPTDERYLVINFKSYKEAIGIKAIELAKLIDEISQSYKAKTIIAPNLVDLIPVARAVENIDVIAQHVDAVEGAHTGSIPIKPLAEYGISGALLNHSEKPLGINAIAKAVEELRKYGLYSIVCTAETLASRAMTLIADFVAFEDPELIGSGISVSTAKPELVKRHIDEIRKGIAVPLVGAGISTAKDVQKALELGAQGVLMASAIIKAKDREKKLREILDALDNF